MNVKKQALHFFVRRHIRCYVPKLLFHDGIQLLGYVPIVRSAPFRNAILFALLRADYRFRGEIICRMASLIIFVLDME